MASKRRSYSVYGRQRLGRIVLNEATNLALAWDPARRFLGRFEGCKKAETAIEQGRGTAPPRRSSGICDRTSRAFSEALMAGQKRITPIGAALDRICPPEAL